MPDPQTLERIHDRYTVKRYIDEGAFAWVFEVEDAKFKNRPTALKLLKPEAAEGEEFRRFKRESELLAGVDHPNIVTIYDFDRDEELGCWYYTMRFVDGPTLKNRLLEGPLPTEEGVRLFIDLLDGLSCLHEQGIVHRDIKPANVLLGRDGRARLSDLGIARVQDERGHTQTGMAVGTALYMSPEQARGRPVDVRSDIFSVGLTLYQTLSGEVVYDHVDEIDSTSGMEVMIYIGSLDQQKDAEFRIVFPKDPAMPKGIQQIIRTACALRADDRYQDARAMRDALRSALYEPPPQPLKPGASWRQIGIAGGALAAVIVAAIVVTVWSGARERAELAEQTRADFEMTRALEEKALGLLNASMNLQPPSPAEGLADVSRDLDRAGDYILDGAEDLDLERYEPSRSNLERARSHLEAACDSMRTGLLSERAEAGRIRLAQQLEHLAGRNAAEVAPESWAALAAIEPRLQAAEAALSGCAAAEFELGRIEAGAEADLASAALDTELAEVWPALVEGARQLAETSRKRALAEEVDAREYKLAVRQGKAAQLRGDRDTREGEFSEARASYGEADEAFQTAFAIVPAARARSETVALSEKLARDGAAIGGPVRLISRGNERYSAGDWAGATDIYKQAYEQLRGMMAQNELRRAVVHAQDLALSTRKSAVAEGAELSAEAPLTAADAQRDVAESALREDLYDEAEQGFASARELYSAARDAAIQAVGDASLQGEEARAVGSGLLAGGGCRALGSEEARRECAQAEEAIERGDAALAARDAPTAAAQFAEALAAFDRTARRLSEWERTKPRPPQLVRRVPAAPRITAFRNKRTTFSVEASDPNDDALRYTWSFDGKRIGESGPRLSHRLEQSGELSVEVDDGAGGSFVESWVVEVENRAPRLSVYPADEEVAVQAGVLQRFRASSADPDGDDVTTIFRLDGKEVERGVVYDFRPAVPGTHTLEVVARDSGGAEMVLTRRVRVEESTATGTTASRAPLLPRQEPPPDLAELSVEGLPSLPGWRGDVIDALERYRNALEEADLDALGEVLVMDEDSPVRAFYARKFQRGEGVEVAIKLVGSIEGSEQGATLDFDQVEVSPTRTYTYRYRASLAHDQDGIWKIERRERRR